MKFGIHTLGCKVNTYESEYIISKLIENNYEIGSFDDHCDIYIINTCTVTNTSDIKSRKIIRSARKRNKDAIIIAVGCYIEANKDNIPEEVDIAIGNKDKSKIIDIINEYIENNRKIIRTYSDFDREFEDMFISTYRTRTRAFVKIQDGCENFCSYCIIPHVRGKCRSKGKETILEEIKTLVDNGFHEVVLTGIHTGNYGTDINSNLATLLREIIKIRDLKRLRISSIEITELTDDVLNLIKNNDVIVNHLHIPIQSASDKILKLMNRKYNIKYFINKIKEIRSIKEDIAITTDIIAGHPYEDEDTFDKSLDVIKEIGFAKLHVFPYSIRKNTEAAKMEQISDLLKKDYARKLLRLSKILENDYMNKFIGKTLEVLIENTKDGQSYGHTTNYLQVKVEKEIECGSFIKVKITKNEYPYCIGEIIYE